jgi:hypothetical protein
MATTGITPPDITSSTGKVRLLIGDAVAVATTQSGIGTYNKFSDRDIEDFLTLAGDNPHRAAGYIYNQWAALAADEAKIVTDVDLKVDLTYRYKALVERANWFFNQADQLDESALLADSFQIVPTGRPSGKEWDSSRTTEPVIISLTSAQYASIIPDPDVLYLIID